MKVDSSPDSYIGSVAGGPQKATAPAAAEAGAAASVASAAQPQPGVTVTLSSSTTEARAVSGAGGDVFNSEKVASMKAAIANGTFQVNAGAIADKMLSNAAEMLGGGRA
jgi:negative regulator of flagellin synthesis FlgM